ncbi:MAG: hypothetical protein ABIG39_02060 [Candidatus Micrarchaeota archaeon]
MIQMRESSMERADLGRDMYFADDVAYDYLSLWNMEMEIRNEPQVVWTVRESVPHDGIENLLLGYEEFISTEYSDSVNTLLHAELDREGTLHLEPHGVRYYHPNVREIAVDGHVSEYRIQVRLDRSCGGCSGSENWNWNDVGDGPKVILDLMDVNGTVITIGGRTSGHVKINGTNTFYVTIENGGVFEIRLGKLLLLEFSNVDAETEIRMVVPGDSALKLYAPVRLDVGERAFQRIALIEK